jgi:hypothetical protein
VQPLTSCSSPGRLAESSPHTLQEDLAILETVFASRDAISGLQTFEKKSHEHTSSMSSTATTDTSPSFEPGAHGRNLSTATGVDTPVIEDVLPQSDKKKQQDALARRFSRRGVRLAIHSSIMDTNAHDVPISLRKKWIHQAHVRQGAGVMTTGGPSTAQLSKISEVNSNCTVDEPPAAIHGERVLTTPDQNIENSSPEKLSSEASSGSGRLSKVRMRGAALASSPMGRQIGKLIDRLSRTSLKDRSENSKPDNQVMEEEHYPPQSADKQSDPQKKEESSVPQKQLTAREKTSWSYRLTRPFLQPEPTTPDYERGF